MPYSRWTPGNCCGCTDCVIFEDLFDRENSTSLGDDWTEPSGDAKIVSEELVFDAAGVVLSEIVPEKSAYIVVTRVELPTDGDKVRIYVGYTDANNHIYVEMERVGDDHLRTSAVKVQAGVPTNIIAAFSSNFGTLDPFTMRATICWNGDTQFLNICFKNSGETAEPTLGFVECSAPPTPFASVTGTYGTGHGLEVVTVGSEVSFSYYQLRTPGGEFPYTCPFCNGPCGNCPDERAPPTMKVVINGSGAGIDGTYLLYWFDGCQWKTEELDGSGSAPLVTATVLEGSVFTPWGSGSWAVTVSYSLWFSLFNSFNYSWYEVVSFSSPVPTCDWESLELTNPYESASTGSAFVTT